MFSKSSLSPTLIQAYQATDYRVIADRPFVLKVGVVNASLAQLLRQMGTNCAAFMTACNPLGQQLSDAKNIDRQSELEQELNRHSLQFISSIGLDSHGEWPGEASVLIFGLSLEAARALGRKYEQNALVWSDQDAVPQLMLLR